MSLMFIRLLNLRTFLSCITLLFLTACHKPTTITSMQHSDSQLSCAQIDTEIQRANQYKQSAREHDRFEMRYLAIFPAIGSAINMHKAEKAANGRIAHLESLKQNKNCFNSSPYGSSPPMQNFPMQ